MRALFFYSSVVRVDIRYCGATSMAVAQDCSLDPLCFCMNFKNLSEEHHTCVEHDASLPLCPPIFQYNLVSPLIRELILCTCSVGFSYCCSADLALLSDFDLRYQSVSLR